MDNHYEITRTGHNPVTVTARTACKALKKIGFDHRRVHFNSGIETRIRKLTRREVEKRNARVWRMRIEH